MKINSVIIKVHLEKVDAPQINFVYNKKHIEQIFEIS